MLLISMVTVGCESGRVIRRSIARRSKRSCGIICPSWGRLTPNATPPSLRTTRYPRRTARISLRTEELADTGWVYEPEFKEVTVEDVSVWNYSNAFVTTLEVWDVRSFTLGTHILVNESLGQRNRVKYQMKRKEGSWVILYRELDQTFDS